MKQIKLLTLTSWNYLVIYTILTLIFFGIFFTIIRSEVFESIDEILYNRKIRILEEIRLNGNQIPPPAFKFTDFILEPVSKTALNKDVYADTVIFETADNEWDEFRKLTSEVSIGEKNYRLLIVAARLETHEIVSGIIKSLSLTFVLMVAAFFFATRFFSKKLWKPFYITLDRLNDFNIDQNKDLELDSPRIKEFDNLNRSITDLTGRARKVFENQKQFIENASHELQTPLAITQGKLEQLIDDPGLTEQQSEIIQTLISSTQRIARLNKTLLLLSKIENDQFLDRENVFIGPIVEEVLTVFDDQREFLQISVEKRINENASIMANRTLVDLLLTNLIKNAFVHNIKGGNINILVTENSFSISNTSEGVAIPKEKLFQRFYKSTTRKDSWGLGLAIANRICTINRWRISYLKNDNVHSFAVHFL